MKIECAGWKQSSCDDGPGMRSVLFLQGCGKNCPGCQNREQQEHGKGIFLNVEELTEYVRAHCKNRKLTISGGEPLEQMEALLELATQLKKSGFNICVYTGWSWKEIPESVLDAADIIKAGGFVETLKAPGLRFVGSSNQIMMQKNPEGKWKAVELMVA